MGPPAVEYWSNSIPWSAHFNKKGTKKMKFLRNRPSMTKPFPTMDIVSHLSLFCLTLTSSMKMLWLEKDEDEYRYISLWCWQCWTCYLDMYQLYNLEYISKTFTPIHLIFKPGKGFWCFMGSWLYEWLAGNSTFTSKRWQTGSVIWPVMTRTWIVLTDFNFNCSLLCLFIRRSTKECTCFNLKLRGKRIKLPVI